MDIHGLGLLLQMLLAWAWACGGNWLGPSPTEVAVSSLLWQRLLMWACLCGCPCLMPVSTEVSGLVLIVVLHKSLIWD